MSKVVLATWAAVLQWCFQCSNNTADSTHASMRIPLHPVFTRIWFTQPLFHFCRYGAVKFWGPPRRDGSRASCPDVPGSGQYKFASSAYPVCAAIWAFISYVAVGVTCLGVWSEFYAHTVCHMHACPRIGQLSTGILD